MGTDRKMSIGTISRANGKQTMPTCIYEETLQSSQPYPAEVAAPTGVRSCCYVSLQDGSIIIRAIGATGGVVLLAPFSQRLEALRSALRLAGGAA